MINKINEFAQNSQTLKEIRKYPLNTSIIRQLLVVAAVIIALIIAMVIISGPFLDPSGQLRNANDYLITLFAFIIVPVIIYLVVIKYEKRSLRSLGIVKEGLVLSALKGLAIGFVMFTAVVLLGIALGQFSFNGVNSSVPVVLVVLFFFAFMIQSFCEELYCRGWAMTYLSRKQSVITAIVLSNIVFILPHMGNNGIDMMAVINIFLIGTVFAVLFWRFDNLWICGGMHTAWNFSQGILFGFNVSGMNTPSILNCSQVGKSLINGGAFGPESSLIATVVIIIALLALLYYPSKS